MTTAPKPNKTGITLEEHHRKLICDAARDFPEIEQVILFGSRALETAEQLPRCTTAQMYNKTAKRLTG